MLSNLPLSFGCLILFFCAMGPPGLKAQDIPFPGNSLDIVDARMICKDAGVLAEWYVENFGYEIMGRTDSGWLELHLPKFTLFLDDRGDVMTFDEVEFKQFYYAPEGYFKHGYLIGGFNTFVNTLVAKGTLDFSDIAFDRHLYTRSALLKDPEGNYVQIYEDRAFLKEDESEIIITPYQFTVLSRFLDGTVDWYRQYLGYSQSELIDMPNRGLHVRLLVGHSQVLEILCIPDKTVYKKDVAARNKRVSGIDMISFEVREDFKYEFFRYLEGAEYIQMETGKVDGWYWMNDNNLNQMRFR